MLAELQAAAERDAVVWLPKVEPHWAGAMLGVISAAGGVLLSRTETANGEAWAWVCLVGLLIGMLLHLWLKKQDTGWRVDFERRRVEPVGQKLVAETITGPGWSIQVAPGQRRSSGAINLHHEERGRVARLLDVPTRRQAELAGLSGLADILARRLGVARTGAQI